jgi:hypothetical protein
MTASQRRHRRRGQLKHQLGTEAALLIELAGSLPCVTSGPELLAPGSRSTRIEQLAREVNWTQLAQTAVRIGIPGLIDEAIVHARLSPPRQARLTLTRARLYVEAQNRHLLGELAAIREDAHALGRTLLPLKGADLLCRDAYALDARRVSDLDLLIEPDAHEALGACLLRRGYRAQKNASHALRHEHHVLYKKETPAMATCVELHHTAVYTLYQCDSFDRQVLHRAKNGLLDATDALLVQCTHLAHNRLRGQLKWPLDILRAWPTIDLALLHKRARSIGAELAIEHVLTAVCELFSTTPPALLAQPLLPSLRRGLLARLAPVSRLFDDNRQPGYLARWLIDLALIDGNRRRSRYSFLKITELLERELGWQLPTSWVRGRSFVGFAAQNKES